MSKYGFRTVRGDAGIGERIKEAALAGGVDGGWDEVSDWALERYDTRIRARLREWGLDVDDDGVLSVETIKEAINTRSGLDIQEFDKAGVREAVEKKLASELSRVLGFEVTSVFDADLLKQQVRDGVLGEFSGGRSSLVGADNFRALKAASTFARAGLSDLEVKRAANRWYSAKYRRNHAQKWV